MGYHGRVKRWAFGLKQEQLSTDLTHHSLDIDGWFAIFYVLFNTFKSFKDNERTMKEWIWRALCNELPFRQEKKLTLTCQKKKKRSVGQEFVLFHFFFQFKCTFWLNFWFDFVSIKEKESWNYWMHPPTSYVLYFWCVITSLCFVNIFWKMRRF